MNKLDIKSSLANINGIITADNSNCGTKAIFSISNPLESSNNADL